jgi:hypothetical protein
MRSALLLHILQFPSLILGPKVGFPEDYRDFLQFLQENARMGQYPFIPHTSPFRHSHSPYHVKLQGTPETADGF